MIVSYPAVFYKYQEGNYDVSFPDFGVVTGGDNLEDATRMAIECLASRIKCLKEYDVEEYARKHFDKSVKKTLTIPKWVNDMASDMDINFSKVLKEALIDKINEKRLKEYENE